MINRIVSPFCGPADCVARSALADQAKQHRPAKPSQPRDRALMRGSAPAARPGAQAALHVGDHQHCYYLKLDAFARHDTICSQRASRHRMIAYR
ncbi:hypothetical protein [Rhodothalassium salexigens]|uniref:hypothetical protein n=1 Tax=Rhodothalassium salexigens TaxID=1086 RepID=UPI0019127A85|nr:hypothetical protein [Rhodothalassium salexigens]